MFEPGELNTFPEKREQELIKLYKTTFPAVAKYISRRGGTLEQAKDVFQDALLLWFEKSASLTVNTTNSAYFFGMVKHLWLRKFSEGNITIPINDELEKELESLNEERISSNRILNLLESTGRKCLNLLKSFYYDKSPMAELAESFGFKTIRSATVQKYKCLEKVRETVKEKSLTYEDFLE